jgi:ribonucleoside-triphosphate reductase
MQSAFVNFGYFDKPFFKSMFGEFFFPDGTQPTWESLCWLQKEFMMWFNEERNKCILTFPVESFALIYKDGKFLDEDSANFVAEEYSRGHSFFTYISDTADSLSSCCRLKNKLQTREFNYTNGNLGVQTGSKSVITLNLSRITQDWVRETGGSKDNLTGLGEHINTILLRVYKYHTAYNELLWEMYDCGLLPVYKAGFINLDKQYLTIGLNGLNQAAEFLGMKCNVNDDYRNFCQFIFGTIKDSNTKASGKYFGHKVTLNTECIPAESLAIKNYNWDKEDGYWVPKDTNLYASYIYKPNDKTISILDKFILHGKDYIGDFLDGGAALHANIDHHFSKEQYDKLLRFAAENGCQYFTFNCVNSECTDCGYISKEPFKVCPKCGGTHVDNYDRIIG